MAMTCVPTLASKTPKERYPCGHGEPESSPLLPARYRISESPDRLLRHWNSQNPILPLIGIGSAPDRNELFDCLAKMAKYYGTRSTPRPELCRRRKPPSAAAWSGNRDENVARRCSGLDRRAQSRLNPSYAASRSAIELETLATRIDFASPKNFRTRIVIQDGSNSYHAKPCRADVGCAW